MSDTYKQDQGNLEGLVPTSLEKRWVMGANRKNMCLLGGCWGPPTVGELSMFVTV